MNGALTVGGKTPLVGMPAIVVEVDPMDLERVAKEARVRSELRRHWRQALGLPKPFNIYRTTRHVDPVWFTMTVVFSHVWRHE